MEGHEGHYEPSEEQRAEEFVRRTLKPGTDEKTIKIVAAKIAKTMQRTLAQARKPSGERSGRRKEK